ncbi:MAG: OsmC family protein [Alphaproteobacteria bacterium]|nr:OsmC family protein [Alphaproteobacteria bacterium]MBL6937696.1 OsmC family protein [Alphaproteobacteria bacterium]MBL7099034.1 OsmC family protein [Alphaproteobacteria bacterium]
MTKRSGSAHWEGDLRTGKGTISTESGALAEIPYSFAKRFGDEKGSNPEEIIGAAHAACFSMALSAELAKAHITADAIDTTSTVELVQAGGGFEIPAVHLTVTVKAPGADRTKVQVATETAKANCPVSKLLRATITMNATYSI